MSLTKFLPLALASLLLAACGDREDKVSPPLGQLWEIGPTVGGKNYSPGVPTYPPVRTAEGFTLEMPSPTIDYGHVHYVTRRPPRGLAEGLTITLSYSLRLKDSASQPPRNSTFRADSGDSQPSLFVTPPEPDALTPRALYDTGWDTAPRQDSEPPPYYEMFVPVSGGAEQTPPATISLFFQRDSDDRWTDHGARWWSKVNPPLQLGDHELSVVLSPELWVSVIGGYDGTHPERVLDWRESLTRTHSVGFTLGNAGRRGHGVFATQPVILQVHSLRVE